MKKLHDISWSNVFADWKSREGSGPRWRRVATEIKGWPDWESWRMFTATQLGLPDRTWTEYELTDPAADIPAMLIGPYSGWQSRFPTPNAHTFADMIAIPAQATEWSNQADIVELGNNFPSPTTMIGLRQPDGRIVLIEGHHRATAVALAAAQHRPTIFGTVTLHLADLRSDETTLLDRVLARGSTKEPPPRG